MPSSDAKEIIGLSVPLVTITDLAFCPISLKEHPGFMHHIDSCTQGLPLEASCRTNRDLQQARVLGEAVSHEASHGDSLAVQMGILTAGDFAPKHIVDSIQYCMT